MSHSYLLINKAWLCLFLALLPGSFQQGPRRLGNLPEFETCVVLSTLMLMLFPNLGMVLSLQNKHTHTNNNKKLHCPMKIHFIPANLQVGFLLDVVLACLV